MRLEQFRASGAGEMPEGHLKSHVVGVNLVERETLFEICVAGRWKHVRVKPGNVSVFPIGLPYAVRWFEPTKAILLEVRPEAIVGAAGNPAAFGEFSPRPEQVSNDPFIAQLALSLRDELSAGSPRGAVFGETLGIALAAHLLHSYSTSRYDMREPRGGLSRGCLRVVTDYIEAHLEQPLSLLELAPLARVSAFHFAHLFKQCTGIAPHRYVLNKRLERGVVLLRDERLPIAEIALRCGFANHSHFSAAFRKALGVSPQEYRRAHANGGL